MKKKYCLALTITFIFLIILIPPMSFSIPLSNTNGECEECHSDFEAFTLTIDAPKEVPVNYDFDYKVIVKNQGEHTVKDMEAIIDLSGAPNLKPSSGRKEPYHNEISGSMSVGALMMYPFPVEENASKAVITLDGDEGILGRNDLDLTVTSPNGKEWSSTSPGADEEVNLDADDIIEGGFGEYNAFVEYLLGRPIISFTLTVDVQYEMDQLYLRGPDLGPGESYAFSWALRSEARGENTINLVVTGTAYHDHEGSSGTDSEEYIFERTSKLKVGEKFVYNPPKEEYQGPINIRLLERITGLLSGLFLVMSIAFCGYFQPICSRIERIVGGKAKRTKWHCRISLLLLLISFIHGILMPFSPHAATLRGLVPGTSAFMILGFLGYIGWQQKPLKKRWGNNRWCRIHLILTILVVIVVIAHALMDGTDFSWLR